MADDVTTKVQECLHELRQPLNVIGLATGNLRSALCPGLNAEQAAYLMAKLDRIDEQIARVGTLAEHMTTLVQEDLLAPRPA
ncbi:hypothetical protein AQZ52_10765 [Novosphingobium fuchskuhlense]|uniref:histidine kinase n=1 Tax=Novosphingobium fuchskuhlense TaxID=1117702 RepID=A0A117UUL0_9SPHN|nr:hypothetical protein [Novosphingobium fuchskuhlense]KUR71145.1 hypothetical protein AQZ52_10765 [Novosphingobium fuchskuhlense]